ncbi:BspA family leucine-rich repeat surface protein [uncultured Tenacibaculum sp.]|uniref:BspA family leucine-rich repeat surface protein n=1 Tax=uncultured Tenacibaculum sp. TaxID=174713 RepID=UPI00263816C7|nr:BspA family leucine-rich repeat surface protein [uncultured Tenacibaculum sp.]
MLKKVLFFCLISIPFLSWAGNGFITTWKVSSEDLSITIPTDFYGEKYQYSVNWGDGTLDTDLTENAKHTYAKPGTYTVEINGVFPSIYFRKLGMKIKEASKLYSIEQWGNIEWKSFSFAFMNCRNLVCNAIDTPNLKGVTDFSFMFHGADNFKGNINNWDVSNITDMSGMFIGADNFNSRIDKWNVSNVTDMSMMFYKATSFNQPIENWDVSKVAYMSKMFSCAYAFNQPIGNWDVSNVTDMSEMFASEIPLEYHSFNQPIGKWNVTNVTNMSYMFTEAVAFNQSLANWNIENVEEMYNMFEYAKINVNNYDATLISWAKQNVKRNISLNAYNLKYCKGKNAIQQLIEKYNWSIKEDSFSCD